jgi:RNA polymerase sigma factor (sigma-70 family)
VYCSISGLGRTGPYADRVAHDLSYQGLTGMLGAGADEGADPTVPATTVADAAAGDADALARIVGAHHDDMARICFVICGDPDMAQDAVQAAWPIAWRKLGSLRDPGRLRPWLMAVAANEARQMQRRQRRHRVVEIEVADVGSPQADPAARAAQTDLAIALRRLSPEDRALLALRHVAGFDATEIGRELGMTASGVRSRLARLLKRLQAELDDG